METSAIEGILFIFNSCHILQIVSKRCSRLTRAAVNGILVNSAQNIRSRLRQRRTQATNGNNGGTADYSDTETDEEDPFGDEGDSDVDYKPGANLDDDEEEKEDLEFNSERQNCDEYD